MEGSQEQRDEALRSRIVPPDKPKAVAAWKSSLDVSSSEEQ